MKINPGNRIAFFKVLSVSMLIFSCLTSSAQQNKYSEAFIKEAK